MKVILNLFQDFFPSAEPMHSSPLFSPRTTFPLRYSMGPGNSMNSSGRWVSSDIMYGKQQFQDGGYAKVMTSQKLNFMGFVEVF